MRKSFRGQGLTEFIIITLLVGVVVLVAVCMFGKSVSCQFNEAAGELERDVSGDSGCPTTNVAADEEPPEAPNT